MKPTASTKSIPTSRKDAIVPPVQSKMDVSPSKSDMDETMSTCESLNSPDVEYIDNNDIAAMESIERKTCSNLNISDHVETTGTDFK